MLKEYNIYIDYYHKTIGNCYGLSIMLNLYDGNFKLIQGGILDIKYDFDVKINYLYKHSWLEKDDIVYDPALRIITPKELYYIFVEKQDEYSKEETENMLRKIGFNLTHFRDFISDVQNMNNETIGYNSLLNKIDTPEMKEEGEKLISLVRKIKYEHKSK